METHGWKMRKIIKRIQGLYPNAYTIYKGKRIKILEACTGEIKGLLTDSKLIYDKSIKKSIAGEIIMINKHDGIMIMTKDFPLKIKYAQLEGKKPTDSYTMSVQSNLNIKDILGI